MSPSLTRSTWMPAPHMPCISSRSEAGWPKVRLVDCTTKAPVVGSSEPTTPLGVKGLKLVVTRAGASYVYSWTTKAQWGRGSYLPCREFRIKLTDGTIHSAIYRFQRASP